MSVDQGQAPDAAPLIPLHCLRQAEPGPPRLAALPTGTPVWVVTRHADVRQVLTDPKLNRAALYAPDAPPTTLVPNLIDNPDGLLNLDGPEHQQLRRTVQRAFTPRAIARWRPWVESVVTDLLDALVASGPPADVVGGFTRSLPIAVISRLMGLDGHDFERLSHWSDAALATTAYTAEEIAQKMQEFGAFAFNLVLERRKNPGDDLVSSLVQAAEGVEGITELQLTTLVCGLVVAGHETTMTSLANALVYLAGEDREGWQRLGADPGSVPAAVEHLLRVIPLSDTIDRQPGLLRRTVEDVEIGGVLIPAGSVVAANTTTGNQDPDVYPNDAGLFDQAGTPSLTFGAGPHHCLGAWLARMELELALHHLARRLPELRLAVPLEEIDWRRGLMTRSPRSLPVTW